MKYAFFTNNLWALMLNHFGGCLPWPSYCIAVICVNRIKAIFHNILAYLLKYVGLIYVLRTVLLRRLVVVSRRTVRESPFLVPPEGLYS